MLRWALLGASAAAAAAAGVEPPAATMKYHEGKFKVLQFADMHFENGRNTTCSDIAAADEKGCTDMNTTQFLAAAIQLERPQLVVFSGVRDGRPLPLCPLPPCPLPGSAAAPAG